MMRKKQKQKKKNNISIRYASLAIAFSAVCLAFVIALAAIQIRGPQTEYVGDGDTVRRTVTVAGVRGEIYDRNGKLLVGNSTTYTLNYEYGAMPYSFDEINAELIALYEMLEESGNADKLCPDFFVLEGVYPNVRFTAAAKDTSSLDYYYFERLLKRKNLSADIEAVELAEYYINRCGLTEDKYTPSQIKKLMRLWYEMDRVDFGAYNSSFTIATDISEEFTVIANQKNITGATFLASSERVYMYPGVASHILGRIGKITAEDAEYYSELGYPSDCLVGINGCELAFESILHGEDGKMVVEYDKGGNVVNKYYEKEPISGKDIRLTIDIDVQIAAEEGLAYSVSLSEDAQAGAITAMDPNSGAVLAVASYPTYDLSRFSESEYYAALIGDARSPLLNRALGGTYAPGSTYKIGVALAALELGAVDVDTQIVCTGQYPHLHRPNCNGVHGETDIFLAIQESCNIFFYSIGESVTTSPITDYTTRLGLGTPTGLELADKTGIVAGPEYREENRLESWGAGDDLSAAIGQSDHGYSPLQLSVYMSSVVNGGTRYRAHILHSVRDFYEDRELSAIVPEVLDRVEISEENYDILIEGMRRVVANNGEVSKYFVNVGVEAGGKTGTAEVSGKTDTALFCGFAPYDDPQIVVSCVVEEGLHGYYASSAVAKVMEEFFN